MATIATGLPWISTFPSRNDADSSQICCCLRDTSKNLWPSRKEGVLGRCPGGGSAVPCQVLDPVSSSRGFSQSHLHQSDPAQNLSCIPNPGSLLQHQHSGKHCFSAPTAWIPQEEEADTPTALGSAAACGQTQCCTTEHEGIAH